LVADNAQRTRLARYAKEGIGIEDISAKISKQFGLSDGEILKRGKNNLRSEARKVCAYTLNHVYDIPVIQIARYFIQCVNPTST